MEQASEKQKKSKKNVASPKNGASEEATIFFCQNNRFPAKISITVKSERRIRHP